MRYLSIIIFLLESLKVFGQDTLYYETIESEMDMIATYKFEEYTNSKITYSIGFSKNSGDLNIILYKYSNDSAETRYIKLRPHYPDSVDPINLNITYLEIDDTSMTNDEDVLLPCPYLWGYPTKYFRYEKLLSCEFDTVEDKTYLHIYNKDNKLLRGYLKNKDSLKLTEQRFYNLKGLLIREETRCDTFEYEYDSLYRRIKESYNYDCDKFRYQIINKYQDGIKLMYGIENGKPRLVGKVIKTADKRFKKVTYYEDGIIEEIEYENEEKPIVRNKFKKGKLQESRSWEYITDAITNAEITITKNNGNIISRKERKIVIKRK
jgi:hypothetical protein